MAIYEITILTSTFLLYPTATKYETDMLDRTTIEKFIHLYYCPAIMFTEDSFNKAGVTDKFERQAIQV